MIYHEVSQQSDQWYKMRLGLATASRFGQLITPKTGQFSKSMDPYANQLIGEMVTGKGAEKFESYWMERGAMLEQDASASYEVITGYSLDRGGFLTNDEMTIGASPDRRVLDASGNVIGGTEIKCPSEAVHIENLLRMKKHGTIDPDYIPQVQGQILIGKLEFVDWFSYHPDMPPALIRTERDDDFCNKLEDALGEFDRILREKIDLLQSMGMIIPPRPILAMYDEAIQRDGYATYLSTTTTETTDYRMAG